MNSRILPCLILFYHFIALCSDQVNPYFSIRSQSRDKVRQIVGVADKTHLYNRDWYYITSSLLGGYTQSFHPSRITECIFGKEASCSGILIQGSEVANRNRTAWLADYFYLPPDFESIVKFKPRIQNTLIDVDVYVELDPWMCGMYFRGFFPIVNSRWNLHPCEDIISTGSSGYDTGYFAATEIPRTDLLESFLSFAAGNAPVVDGLLLQPLVFAKICPQKKSVTKVAEIRAELGWNFWLDQDYHLGVNIQTAVPTGTKPSGFFAFEPQVGNGHHWELGGGITGHYIFWRALAEENHFGLYFDMNFTHLFKTRQTRVFDLKDKPNSRYMLAAQLPTGVSQELGGSTQSVAAMPIPAPIPALMQFKEMYAPVANLTGGNVYVEARIQADIVAWFNLLYCNVSWDIGYNFWARSREKISCTSNSQSSACINQQNLCIASSIQPSWVLKGDARMFGFTTDGDATPVGLSASQQKATINSGINALRPETNATLVNTGIDNPLFAYATTDQVRLVYSPTALNDEANHIRTSIQPIVLSCRDIDFNCSRGITHKIFTHLSYTLDCNCWQPFLGFGGFVEFAKHNTNTHCSFSSSSCNESCSDCAISQWGIWLKGGFLWN